MDEGHLITAQLNVIMNNLCEGHPAKIAEWLSASHVERTGKKKDDDQPPTPGGGTPPNRA